MSKNHIPESEVLKNNYCFLSRSEIKDLIVKNIARYQVIKQAKQDVLSAFDQLVQEINQGFESAHPVKTLTKKMDKNAKINIETGSQYYEFKEKTFKLAELLGFKRPDFDYTKEAPSTLEQWQSAINAEEITFEAMVLDWRGRYMPLQKEIGEVVKFSENYAARYLLKGFIEELLNICFKHKEADLIALATHDALYTKDNLIETPFFSIKFKENQDDIDWLHITTYVTLKFHDLDLLAEINKHVPVYSTVDADDFEDFD